MVNRQSIHNSKTALSLLLLILVALFTGCKTNLSTEAHVTQEKLTAEESELLNRLFEDERGCFDFSGKKIGFIECCGSMGKKYYFDMVNQEESDSLLFLHRGELYIFNSNEKYRSGGYDAAITYFCKFIIQRKEVIRRLKRSGGDSP